MGCKASESFLLDKPLLALKLISPSSPPSLRWFWILYSMSCCPDSLPPAYTKRVARLSCCVAGLHKSDQQYLKSGKDKTKKPNEEFLYATTASKRAERQRLVRFIRSVTASAVSHPLWQMHATVAVAALYAALCVHEILQ